MTKKAIGIELGISETTVRRIIRGGFTVKGYLGYVAFESRERKLAAESKSIYKAEQTREETAKIEAITGVLGLIAFIVLALVFVAMSVVHLK